jgi:hypothetical protein
MPVLTAIVFWSASRDTRDACQCIPGVDKQILLKTSDVACRFKTYTVSSSILRALAVQSGDAGYNTPASSALDSNENTTSRTLSTPNPWWAGVFRGRTEKPIKVSNGEQIRTWDALASCDAEIIEIEAWPETVVRRGRLDAPP